MPSGEVLEATYEANIIENSPELCSLLDFLPFEDIESSDCNSYLFTGEEYENSTRKDYTVLNGDDKFLDSILKGLFDNSEYEKELSGPGTIQSLCDDDLSYKFSNLFEQNINLDNSVLGVNLDLYSNNNIVVENLLGNNLDNFLDDSGNDLDDLELSSKVNEIFINTAFDYNFITDSNQTIEGSTNNESTPELINLFPHINDEKNRRRRSLLYENTCKVNKATTNCLFEDKSVGYRKNDALLSHDYTQKKSEEEKFFTCPISNCEKVYAKSSHLKAHLRRHSGEKPFVCNWQNCTWKFSRSDELARHKRSHSGIKPYKCELCEKAFARSDHLSKHRKVHKKKMAQCGSYFIKKRTRYD